MYVHIITLTDTHAPETKGPLNPEFGSEAKPSLPSDYDMYTYTWTWTWAFISRACVIVKEHTLTHIQVYL